MTIARLLYSVALFVSGLGVGVLACTLATHHAPSRRDSSDVQSENKKLVAQMKEEYGEETAEFVKQFEDMTIRIKESPINAWAAPDGRFVLRLFGSDDTIASDLWYPNKSVRPKEFVRHYSFSAGGRTWSCDFGRSGDNSKMTEVQFHFTDANGGTMTYVDSDADGRWDKMIDETVGHPMSYAARRSVLERAVEG